MAFTVSSLTLLVFQAYCAAVHASSVIDRWYHTETFVGPPWFFGETFLVMAALCSRCGHYIFALFLSFFLLGFSSPNLSGRRLDVYHISTHGVALVRI